MLALQVGPQVNKERGVNKRGRGIFVIYLRSTCIDLTMKMAISTTRQNSGITWCQFLCSHFMLALQVGPQVNKERGVNKRGRGIFVIYLRSTCIDLTMKMAISTTRQNSGIFSIGKF